MTWDLLLPALVSIRASLRIDGCHFLVAVLITPLTPWQREVFAVAAGLSLPLKPQADVQLTAADTQLLTNHLLAHAAMPPSCNFATTEDTVLLFHNYLGRKLLSEPADDSTLTQSKGRLARSGHS